MSAASRDAYEDWQRELASDEGYPVWVESDYQSDYQWPEWPQSEADMNINEVFPSNYIKASDLQGRKLKLTIDHVDVETIGSDTKPVLYFQGKEKGLVLNKTNAQMLSSSYGPETTEWTGRDCAIYPTKVNFQGQMVDAIRVEAVVAMTDASSVPF